MRGERCVRRCASLLCAFECCHSLLSGCHTYLLPLHIRGTNVIHPPQIVSFTVSPTAQFSHKMDSSQVCGRKVRTLLFGVILGIFAVAHSGFSNGKFNFFHLFLFFFFFPRQPLLKQYSFFKLSVMLHFRIKEAVRYNS